MHQCTAVPAERDFEVSCVQDASVRPQPPAVTLTSSSTRSRHAQASSNPNISPHTPRRHGWALCALMGDDAVFYTEQRTNIHTSGVTCHCSRSNFRGLLADAPRSPLSRSG